MIYKILVLNILLLAIACTNDNTNESLASLEQDILIDVQEKITRSDSESESNIDNNIKGTDIEVNVEAGVLTAGQWSDLENWDFWHSLIQNKLYYSYQKYWHIFPNTKFSLCILNKSNNPLINVKAELYDINDNLLWASKSNNKGHVHLWSSPFSVKGPSPSYIVLSSDKKSKKITDLEKYKNNNPETLHINFSSEYDNKGDIMFLVDATGSMGDEISYLTSEFQDVITSVSDQNKTNFRTAAVFYRDHEDEYLTNVSPFSENLKTTLSFLNEQNADGGGDYPEALDEGLFVALENQVWSDNAKARMLFILLDAPSHNDEATLARLNKSLSLAAQKGITIIPVASSGVDKDTEFLMRYFAMLTGGTYVFLTDHSGIGNGHIEPTIGDYKVEYLNELLIKLINKYSSASVATES